MCAPAERIHLEGYAIADQPPVGSEPYVLTMRDLLDEYGDAQGACPGGSSCGSSN